jgi:succinyl-diaminopimelate desuccinylase
MSHLDVVPEGERSLWHSDPWKVIVKDGAVIGRGVEDNQQGLVASVFATLAFIHQGIVPERTIKLSSSPTRRWVQSMGSSTSSRLFIVQ